MNESLDLEYVTSHLPTGVYVGTVGGRDVVTGQDLVYPVLWTDRPYNRCPLCLQHIDPDLTDKMPVLLDVGACQGGRVDAISQQHGCGEWLSVYWTAFERDGVTEEDLIVEANRLSGSRAEVVEAVRADIMETLQARLSRAAARVTEPLDDERWEDRVDSVCTGSEVEPGIYYEPGVQGPGELIAWEYDPESDSDLLTFVCPIARPVTSKGTVR